MGNCCGVIAGEKPIRIVDSRGEVKKMPAPVTAAELMLDCPGYAVAPVEGLRLTRRVVAAKADEVLVSGKVYLLVPVEKVGAPVSDLQLAALEMSNLGGGKKKKKARRGRMGGSKVLPEAIDDCEEKPSAGVGVGCRRWGNGRPWTPVLEPILEGC